MLPEQQEEQNPLLPSTHDSSETILHLETMLTLSRFNCTIVELNRKLTTIFGGIEDRYRLDKMRGFLKMREKFQEDREKKLLKKVQEKLQKMSSIVVNKNMNLKMDFFLRIQRYSEKQKRLKKYEEIENESFQMDDPDIQLKRKELQILTRKYNRLISEFSVLNQRVSKVMKTIH